MGSKINMAAGTTSEVPIPDIGYVTLFFDSDDNNKPKYRAPNGAFYEFTSNPLDGEWLSSVNSIETDPSLLSPTSGDRFLIDDNAVGDWLGQDGKVAEWTGATWLYEIPTEGTVLKIDNDTEALYVYENGNHPSGSWIRKPFSSTLLTVPTDGNWSDGVFDFENVETIDAIDQINELLASIVPAKAPILSNTNASRSVQMSAALSFDSTQTIGGYIGADIATSNPIPVDGVFLNSGKRLGVSADDDGDITGILNYQVTQGSGIPNPSYPADSMGDGNLGELRLYINGVLSDTIDLTNTSAQDSTTGGTTSGFNISAAISNLFPGGDEFPNFKYRTGTWRVIEEDLGLGYNYIEIIHYVSAGDQRSSGIIDLVIDDDDTNTTFSGESLGSLSMTGAKKLSGIEYNTDGTAEYSITIENAHRNTYSIESDAISHNGNNCSANDLALSVTGGDESKTISISGKTVTINNNIAIIDGAITIDTTVKRSIQSQQTSSGATITGILMDDKNTGATNFVEDFLGEDYRLPSNIDFDNHGAFSTGMWDSEQSIDDGSAGYTNGLQIINGQLLYPSLDFRSSAINSSPNWNDGSTKGSARDYSSLTGSRTYIRWFKQTSPTVGNFTLNISGSNGTFVDVDTSLNGNNIHVEVRGPSETGWMDAYEDFSAGNWDDGDGARNATNGLGRAFGTNWGLTMGTKNTANTGGYFLVRVTVGQSFSGVITGMSLSFG